jgi:hypothetical protein
MPAAKWFDEIILSDYTPANLEAQKKWLNKDKDAADWTQYFKHYSKLDGNEYVDHVVTFIYLFHGWRARLEYGRSWVHESQSCQIKDYQIGIFCFSAKHAAISRKRKDWLTRNQDNVSEWGKMHIRGLLFQ